MTVAASSKLQIEIPYPKESITIESPQTSQLLQNPPILIDKRLKRVKDSLCVHPDTSLLHYKLYRAAASPEHYYVDPTGFPLEGNPYMRASVQFRDDKISFLLSREIEPSEYEDPARRAFLIAIENNLAPPTFFLNSTTGTVILFQTYLYGKSLHQIIGWEPIRVVKEFQKHIIHSLVHAFVILHKNTVFMRALNPNDIFFQKRGQKKSKITLLNFSHATDSAELSKGLFGSPLYAPPEAKTKAPYCPQKADLFILGLNLYYVLSGDNLNMQIPKETLSPKKLQKTICHIITSTTPPRFAPILKGLLQVDPNERFSAFAIFKLFSESYFKDFP